MIWCPVSILHCTNAFLINDAICNKTVPFCNKKSSVFRNKLLSHFVTE